MPAEQRRKSSSSKSLTKLVAVGGCGCVIVAVACFRVYPQYDASLHWRAAERAIAQRDLIGAFHHLEHCLTAWPNSAETHFLTGRVERRLGHLGEAEEQLHQARRLGWVDELIDLEYLLIKAQTGDARAAEPALRGYLESGHRDAELILEALVIGYRQKAFLDGAYRWSTVWVEGYPDSPVAHVWHGRVLEAGLRYDLAANAYGRAIELGADDGETHFHRAQVLMWKGRFAEARTDFQKCLQADPENPAALLGLARCQRVLDPPEAARAALDDLLRLQPRNAGGLLLRGELELDAGRPEAACEWLRAAEKENGGDLETCQTWAAALRQLGKMAEAKSYDDRRKSIRDDHKRIDELTQEITLHPELVGPRYEGGVTLLRLGQVEEGLRWLAGALQLDPQHEPSRRALADALRRRK
jgi:tetratricopeptide (TPR) repeat protein